MDRTQEIATRGHLTYSSCVLSLALFSVLFSLRLHFLTSDVRYPRDLPFYRTNANHFLSKISLSAPTSITPTLQKKQAEWRQFLSDTERSIYIINCLQWKAKTVELEVTDRVKSRSRREKDGYVPRRKSPPHKIHKANRSDVFNISKRPGGGRRGGGWRCPGAAGLATLFPVCPLITLSLLACGTGRERGWERGQRQTKGEHRGRKGGREGKGRGGREGKEEGERVHEEKDRMEHRGRTAVSSNPKQK